MTLSLRKKVYRTSKISLKYKYNKHFAPNYQQTLSVISISLTLFCALYVFFISIVTVNYASLMALHYANTATSSCGRINQGVQRSTDGWKIGFYIFFNMARVLLSFECLLIFQEEVCMLYCNFRNGRVSLITLILLMPLKCFQLKKAM